MSERIVRFVGDPNGYLVDFRTYIPENGPWAEARINGRVVSVNINQAYLIERDVPIADRDDFLEEWFAA